MKYADGNDVRVGDECACAGSGETCIVESLREQGHGFRGKRKRDGSTWDGRDMSLWTLVSRAPAAPVDKHGREMRAGDLVEEDEDQFAPGSVWLGETYAYDHAVRGNDGWYLLGRHSHILSRVGTQKNSWASVNANYGGNLRAVFSGLVALHTGHAATIPAPPPAPERTAESLMADRRAKAKAEAEALQGRYAAFRETVERTVAAEAPHARVVTDIVPGHFIGWIDFGHGLQRVEVRDDWDSARFHGVASDVGYLAQEARNVIGARALRNPAQATRREG